MTDPIRATIEAPKRVEGVGELALELVEMAEAASNGSRFGDAHFLKRAADLLAQYHPAPPAGGEVAELVAWLTMLRDHDLRHDAAYAHPTIADHWNGFLTRAAELLEQRHPAPVPVVYAPTDEELLELADDSDMDRLEGERGYPDGTVINEGYWEAWDHQLLAFARAVLAKYGTTPVPTPVPVSERLPRPEDCDAEGRCWCFDPAADPEIMDGVPSWEFSHWEMEHTHWIPANTLPMPQGEAQP